MAAISAGQQAWNIRVPKLTISNADLGFVYRAEETESRSAEDVALVVAQKQRQYEDMVSRGKMSRGEADAIIQSIKSQPLNASHTYLVSFTLSKGTLLVTATSPAQRKLEGWTMLTGDYTVEQGWQGGENITLTNQPEPYTSAVTKVPILPLQLPGISVFVDMEPADGFVSARMLCVSTGREDYFTCKLQFSPSDGLLRSAEVPGIERWTYDDYSSDKVPIPGTITLERRFDKDGNPEVTAVYKRTRSAGKAMQLNDLILGPGVAVVDRRTDPIRQFTYWKGRGTLLDQARMGVPVIPDRRPTTEPTVQLSAAGISVTVGCLLLAGISIYGLMKRRPRGRVSR